MPKGTKQIGRPGRSKGYEVPEGFQLWEYSSSGLSGQHNLIGYPGVSGGKIFEFQNNDLSLYDEGDIQVWLLRNHYTESSRAWTAAGSSPRLQARYFIGGQWAPNIGEVKDEDPMNESVSCDAGDQQRSSVSISRVYYVRYNGNFNPLLQIGNRFVDPPGSRNLCYSNGLLEARVLFKTEHFIRLVSDAADCTRIG